MDRRTTLSFVALTLAGLMAGCVSSVQREAERIHDEAVMYPDDPQKVDAYIAMLPEEAPGSRRYIVEGDIVLSRGEIPSYLKGLKTPAPPEAKSGELIVNLLPDRKKMDYLVTPEQRKMVYVVESGSFPSPAAAQAVRGQFSQAANDWVKICPECGISFTEASAADVAAGRARPYFRVRYANATGGPIARAFFPSSPMDEREVLIFPTYFAPSMGFAPVGVLRHEIGHILGYRHEHIRNIPGCYTEGTSWLPLTRYTPKSVMHYFCGGAGNEKLTIEKADEEGHRCLYLTGKACPQK